MNNVQARYYKNRYTILIRSPKHGVHKVFKVNTQSYKAEPTDWCNFDDVNDVNDMNHYLRVVDVNAGGGTSIKWYVRHVVCRTMIYQLDTRCIGYHPDDVRNEVIIGLRTSYLMKW